MDCQTARTEMHIDPAEAALRTHFESCPRCAAYAERMGRLDRVVRGELVVQTPAVLSERLHTVVNGPAPERSRLDAAVRDELLTPVPPALSQRLGALVLQPASAPKAGAAPVDAALREALVLQAPAELTARLEALVPKAHTAPAQGASVPAARPRRWVVATVYLMTSALLLVSLMYAGQVYGLVIAQLGLEAWLAQVASLPAELLNQLYALVPQSRVVIGTLIRMQQPLQWMLVALVLWAVIDMTQRQRQPEGARQYA